MVLLLSLKMSKKLSGKYGLLKGKTLSSSLAITIYLLKLCGIGVLKMNLCSVPMAKIIQLYNRCLPTK